MLGLRSEPPVEFRAAPVAWRRGRLGLAFRRAGRTGKAPMEMIIVAPPWANDPQPVTVAAGFAAQRSFDWPGDEDALHDGDTPLPFWPGGRGADGPGEPALVMAPARPGRPGRGGRRPREYPFSRVLGQPGQPRLAVSRLLGGGVLRMCRRAARQKHSQHSGGS